MKRRFLLATVLLLGVYSQGLCAEGQQEVEERISLFRPILQSASQREVIAFADQLYEKEDYYNALTMYQYALYRSATDHEKESLRFRIGLCYEMGERYDDAKKAFDDFIGFHPQSTKAPEASYRIGQGYFRNKDFVRAVNHFKETMEQFPDSAYARRSQYALGLSYARLTKWNLSQEELNRLAAEHPEEELSKRARDLSLFMEEGKKLPRKSPELAAILSVVPGLGKLYTTHYGGAIIALLINGGLGFVIYDSFDHDRYAVGAVFSTLAAATYSANIIGGYRSAKRYNARQEDRFGEKVSNKGYIPELGLER